MKADEVLKRYAAGERNFCGTNLRGESFKNQDLSGADFSQSDIRGTNFSQAILRQTNFSQCRAGLTLQQTLFLTVISWGVAAIAGCLSSAAIYLSLFAFIPSGFLPHILGNDYLPGMVWTKWLTPILLVVWLLASRWLSPTIFGLLWWVVLTFIFVILALLKVAGFILADNISHGILAVLLGSFALDTMGAVAYAALKVMARKIALAFGVGIAIQIIATIWGISYWSNDYHSLNPDGLLGIVIHSLKILLPIAAATFSVFVGVGIFQDADNRPWLRKLIIALVAARGTSFQHANLSDANFTSALLPNTNFQAANFTRAHWSQARSLHLAQIERTYLADAQIQHLVTSGQGQGQTFDYKDLRGVNLQSADLAEASFVGVNLSEANLAGANLARAKLVRTQLYRANLSNAILTGAYIQDWGISTDTQFDGVQCDYIYMRLPTPADPDPCRKPDNRNETFAAGDFENFIAPIIKTLDLYSQQNVDPRHVAEAYKTIDLFHHEGIDPGAAAIALQQLAEQHPEAGIEVIALEGRGQDQIRLQAVVSGQANRSELSAQYSENYRQLKSLPYTDLQSLLSSVTEKDQQIHRLETMLEQAIQQPRFYVETYRHQGEFIMSQSKGNIQIENVQGNVSGVAAAGDHLEMTGTLLGEISGTVTNTINQLPTSSDPDQPGLRELLSQLQAAIEAERELNDEDKAEALEQVKVFAEAGQKPEEGALRKAAKTAMKILKGTIAGLPSATELVQESSKLLVAISALLAIV